MNKPNSPSPAQDEIDKQLARGLRGTSARLERGFDQLEARVAATAAADRRKVVLFPRPVLWLAGSAAAVLLGLAGLQWLGHTPPGELPAAKAPLSPVVLEEMLFLDETLQPARLLLDADLLLAFLEMPYENNNH